MSPPPGAPLRIATRGSALARWQAEHVTGLLGGDAVLVVVDTLGDRDTSTSLDQLGGRGIFVKEVQAAVLDGRADLAVHSAKDLPSSPELLAPGLVLGCVPRRGDPRDALVGSSLDDLAPGAPIATGSARRRALLADLRPDLTFVDVRGNIGTRLERVPAGGALVVAAAALERLGVTDRTAEALPTEVMVPMVGQGALALECRAGDDAVLERLAAAEDEASRRAVDAERSWLATIGGGCDLPAGAHAVAGPDGELRLTSVLASRDGRVVLRASGTGHDPAALGRRVAEELL
ncbi:MAG: hydroxymethylbilane synthase, partial [Acidimicrobiia bacterium]